MAATAVMTGCSGGGGSDGSVDPPGGPGGGPGGGFELAAGNFPVLSGREAIAWQPLEMTFSTGATSPIHSGPPTQWDRAPGNPWLDWRFDLELTRPDGRRATLPGYYAGDGDGGPEGDVWAVRFTPPNLPGQWDARVTLKYAPELNVAPKSVSSGAIVYAGQFRLRVEPPRPNAKGFYSRGPVRPDGRGRLRTADGALFVKAGIGSPENFLGYVGFDGAMDGLDGGPPGAVGGAPDFLHAYGPHVADWRIGDPDWAQGAGRGLIGALNFLGDAGVTAMYVMPMNLGGDGRDTFPFASNSGGARFPADRLDARNYAVRRLDQWNTALEHAQTQGIYTQIVLAEREPTNIGWLGDAASVERRLYLKQMVAHFGHLPAIEWTMCEENGAPTSMGTEQFTPLELSAMASWIRDWDIDAHPRSVHIDPNDLSLYEMMLNENLAGWVDCLALQVNGDQPSAPELYGQLAEEAAELFRVGLGKNLPVHIDEPGYFESGVGSELHPDAWLGILSASVDDKRRRVLYDSLFSGAGVLWYFGYYAVEDGGGDLRTEDFRTRATMLEQTATARELIESTFASAYEFGPHDELWVSDVPDHPVYGAPEVVAETGGAALVFLPWLGTSTSNSPGSLRPLRGGPPGSAVFSAVWVNPRTGGAAGSSQSFDPTQPFTPGPPPGIGVDPDQDWILRVVPF